MTLYSVSLAIRQHGGIVWLLQMIESGTVFRVDYHGQQLRIVVPRLGKIPADVPAESNSLLYVAVDELRLQDFLTQAKKIRGNNLATPD